MENYGWHFFNNEIVHFYDESGRTIWSSSCIEYSFLGIGVFPYSFELFRGGRVSVLALINYIEVVLVHN